MEPRQHDRPVGRPPVQPADAPDRLQPDALRDAEPPDDEPVVAEPEEADDVDPENVVGAGRTDADRGGPDPAG